MAPKKRTFPKGFRWGVATSAYQIEGNNSNSDYWFLESVTPTTFIEHSGDACDSYHRYEKTPPWFPSLYSTPIGFRSSGQESNQSEGSSQLRNLTTTGACWSAVTNTM